MKGNYATLDLSLCVEDARRRITDRVTDVAVRPTDDGYEFRSHSGFRLGSLTPVRLSDGSPGSRLAYRTTLLSPSAAHARQTAHRIRSAVEPFAVKRS